MIQGLSWSDPKVRLKLLGKIQRSSFEFSTLLSRSISNSQRESKTKPCDARRNLKVPGTKMRMRTAALSEL